MEARGWPIVCPLPVAAVAEGVVGDQEALELVGALDDLENLASRKKRPTGRSSEQL
jgi:hypothetical protein